MVYEPSCHILQNNVDKKFLVAPHERSVQKLIESRIIRKSIFWIASHINQVQVSMTNIGILFSTTQHRTRRFAIKKKSSGGNSIFSEKMEKNQYREWFFDKSGNRCEKSDPENPYICILDQHFIAYSSKVIGLKSTQNFGHVRH